MRKYIYAQMLLDIMTVMKRPTPELKSTARAWLMHAATIPDMLADDVGHHGMITPYGMQQLHAQLIDKPVGKIRGKAEEVVAWVAEEEEFEVWKSLPEVLPDPDDPSGRRPFSGENSNIYPSTADQAVQDMIIS
jgi:hypothetical protein